MALVDAKNLDAINRAFDKSVQSTLSTRMPGTWTLFTKRQGVDGTSVDIVYADTGAQLREWFGSRQLNGARVFSKNIPLRKWEKSLELDVDDINGDKTGALGELVANFVEDSAADLEKVVVEELLSNPAGADGVSLFSNSHPYAGGGTKDNLTTNALDRGELSTAMKKLRAMKNAAGQSLNIRGTHLLVGPDQEEKALDLTGQLKAVTVGESGEINAGSSGVGSTAQANPMAGGIQVIVSGEIGGNEWTLMDLSKRSKPMALYEFNGESLRGDRFSEPDDYNVVVTNKAQYFVTGKISPAALDWRLCYGSVTS